MKISIWYEVSEKLPDHPGRFLALRVHNFTLDTLNFDEVNVFHWDGLIWKELHTGIEVTVACWTDVTLDSFIGSKPALNAAEQAAFDAAHHAIEQFNIVRSLSKIFE